MEQYIYQFFPLNMNGLKWDIIFVIYIFLFCSFFVVDNLMVAHASIRTVHFQNKIVSSSACCTSFSTENLLSQN